MHLFDRIAKAKSDALTELLHRYLEFLYENVLQMDENKLWMREGDLDKPLGGPYLNQTLRSVLCGYRTAMRGLPNILIFQGEKGNGRKFFIKKMIGACYESIHHIGWEQAQKETVSFRFPIYITKNEVQELGKGHGRLEIEQLVYQCVIQQLKLTDKYELQIVQELLTELGHMGKLALFFEEETCRDKPDLIDRIDTPAELEYRPIAVFVELPQFEPKERDNSCRICIEPLTERQIAGYLAAELPDQYNFKETQRMLQEQSEVAAILCKPEWLQLHIRVVREDIKRGKTATINQIYQIYEAFLSAQLDLAFESQTNRILSRKDLEVWLTQRAREEASQESASDNPYLECFAGTEIFHKQSADFRFEGCKHFLIAKSYISPGMTAKDIRRRLTSILMNENLMVLKFFASLYIAMGRHMNTLFKQLVSLMDDPTVGKKYKEPAVLLADVLTFMKRVDADGPEFVKWACREMRKSTYDTSVLETISKLNRANPNVGIITWLGDQYSATDNAREKRRIAYCFGYVGQGDFSNQLIEDLCAEDPLPLTKEKLHLKYHISAALVDKRWQAADIRDQYPALERALSRHTDPILRSDFEVLYALLNGPEQQYRDAQNECENQLIQLLADGPYWQKAHAAGALGRRSYGPGTLGIRSVVVKLTETLNKTLSMICGLQDEGGKELKTVSYIVEACCQLAEKNGCRDWVKVELQKLLESYLNNLPDLGVSIVAYKHLQAALRLVNTGVVYLLDGEGSIRTKLGLCFSSTDSILQTLSVCYREEAGVDWQNLKDAIQRLEEWSTPEKAEQELAPLFPDKAGCGRKLNFSLTYLWYKDKPMMVGFLFLFQNDIYFITCRHSFFAKEGDKYTLRLLSEELGQVSFSPACLDDHGRYHGILCYPENLCAPVSFEGSADEDIVIYRLTDIPASFAHVIFTEKDLPGGKIGEGTRLEAFSFPETSRTQGKWFLCSGYREVAHGFFTMREDRPFDKNDAFWFSGAPIVRDSKIVAGMWKGSRGARSEVWGITIQSVLDKINQIVRNGGNGNE